MAQNILHMFRLWKRDSSPSTCPQQLKIQDLLLRVTQTVFQPYYEVVKESTSFYPFRLLIVNFTFGLSFSVIHEHMKIPE